MKWFVTWFYTGCIPGAPGTWGSLATLPLAYLLHWQGGFVALCLATCFLYVTGHWATHIYLQDQTDTDPSEVVIDEVVGQLIALWPLSLGLGLAGVAPHVVPWPGWVAAFILFRIFDIFKPWPIRKFEALGGAAGVMLDDVVAGIIAAILIIMSATLAHGWLL